MNIDQMLLSRAEEFLGTHGTTQTVHRALEEVVKQHGSRWLMDNPVDLTYAQLAALRANTPFPDDPARRRVAEAHES